ncbi:ATP-binding protein, partial [Pseudomonas viridiflava]|uniref:ATP-binding protein n=1 Tax=Pseudomonas viridiflava TaxID=33069 RepID=UPI001F14ADF6
RTVGPAIDMQVRPTQGLWSTMVDQHQLENSLLNLCINAKDAMPDGGQLLIETGNRYLDSPTAAKHELTAGRYVELTVSDTGTGMTKEVMGRAFDPFFTTKPIGMGTGLGLSMIYGFARQSGGGVSIFSETGEG